MVITSEECKERDHVSGDYSVDDSHTEGPGLQEHVQSWDLSSSMEPRVVEKTESDHLITISSNVYDIGSARDLVKILI